MSKKCQQKSIVLSLLVGLALSSLNFVSVTAEEDPTYELDQVVVTATKTEKKLRDVPAAVEVITKEEMDKRNIKRVDDALKSIAGVYVRQAKGVLGGSSTDSISMRGFGKQKQVLVLLDGQPINDGYSGGVSLANIPTENVDRIEVSKGPASALYGSNAMGGVINIITKDKAKQETIVRFGGGGKETNSQSIYTSGSTGKIDYFITAERTASDGYLTNPNIPSQGNNGMKRELYDGKLVYHLDDKSKLSLSAGSNNYRYFYQGSADRGESNEDIWGLIYENKFSSNSSLKVSYGEKKVDYWYVSGTTYAVNPSKTTQAEIQYNFKMGDRDALTVGYSRRAEQGDSFPKTLTNPWNLSSVSGTSATTNVNMGGKSKTDSFYIQDERKVNERTTLYLGGRYDNWSFYDGYTYGYTGGSFVTKQTPENSENSFNPKLGVVHKLNDKLTVRSSIGKAFRAPYVNELAKDWTGTSKSKGVTTTTYYKSNSNLKPEKSINYEVGFDYQADKTLLAKVNIFHSDVTDAIDTVTTTLSSTATTKTQEQKYVNSDKARVNGFEIGLTKRLSKAWSSFINYTYTDAKVVSSTIAPKNIGKQVGSVPKQLFNIGFNYEQGRWQGSLIGNYVSEANTPEKQGTTGYGTYEAHFTVDTKISYKMTKDTTLSLSIDNLLNREYYSSYLAPSRTTYLELTHKF